MLLPARLALFFSLCLVSACAAPSDDACARFSVDEQQSLHEPPVPLGLVGVPVRVRHFAPLTSCLSDELRMDVRLTDPLGEPLVGEGALAVTGAFGAVRGEVVFTPLRAGPHHLQLSFEPSLGRRSLVIDVAENGEALPSALVHPDACGEAWPLRDDVVACEGAGVITLHDAAGEVAAFPGRELVVVDDVLWSLDPDGVLERREDRGGALVRTHALAGFVAGPVAAQHDRDFAVRARADGHIRTVRVLEDGGVRERATDATVRDAFLFDRDDALISWTGELMGAERGLVWRATPTGVSAYGPPWDRSAPLTSLGHRPAATARPAASFERVPLWLDAPLDDGRRALVTLDARGLSLTAWDAARVLRVGRRHVLLAEPGGLRIFTR